MCKICGFYCKNIVSLSHHLRLHGISLLDYHIKYEKFVIPTCKFCNKSCKYINGLSFQGTCGEDSCKKKMYSRPVTQESKNKISISRKKWLVDNPDLHPWKRSDKFKSIPCEYLKSLFTSANLKFVSELQPLDDKFYSIDIAFPDKLIAVEVNGNQHYNSDGSLKDYYKKRKDEIELSGWKVYDIPYQKVYDKNFVKDLIDFISGSEVDISFEFKPKEKSEFKCSCGNIIARYSKVCNVCQKFNLRKVERPPIEKLKSEVENFGYSATGRKYGVSDNSIRKWIKNFSDSK